MATLDEVITELGLTMTAEFIPFSKSRNAKINPKINERSLNWRVTLYTPQTGPAARPDAKRKIIETDYSAGFAHCPSYKYERQITVYQAEVIKQETETGRKSHSFEASVISTGKPILPKITDVVYGLMSDASAIDEPDFESWAMNIGYNPDSRSAEKTYNACLKIGLTLRALLGDEALSKLREAAQDY